MDNCIANEGIIFAASPGGVVSRVLENGMGPVGTKGAAYHFVAMKDERLIGWARVLSDDVLCAWVSQIRVEPEWRGQGIGRGLMTMAHARFRHTPLWAGTPEPLVPFFLACGLKLKAKLRPCARDERIPLASDWTEGGKPMANPDQNLSYTTDTKRLDMKSLGGLFEAVGFGTAENYENDAMSVEKFFGPGVFGFLAFDDARLVGLARVLSDEILCSWVSEICVHPEYQEQGIGNTLLEMVNSRFPDTSLYVDAFKGQEPFFAKNGINPQSRVVACGRAPLKT